MNNSNSPYHEDKNRRQQMIIQILSNNLVCQRISPKQSVSKSIRYLSRLNDLANLKMNSSKIISMSQTILDVYTSETNKFGLAIKVSKAKDPQ